jgi:hypothetical protein
VRRAKVGRNSGSAAEEVGRPDREGSRDGGVLLLLEDSCELERSEEMLRSAERPKRGRVLDDERSRVGGGANWSGTWLATMGLRLDLRFDL